MAGDSVKIGALLPLSGVRASSGKSTEAALVKAIEDVYAHVLRYQFEHSLRPSNTRYRIRPSNKSRKV